MCEWMDGWGASKQVCLSDGEHGHTNQQGIGYEIQFNESARLHSKVVAKKCAYRYYMDVSRRRAACVLVGADVDELIGDGDGIGAEELMTSQHLVT